MSKSDSTYGGNNILFPIEPVLVENGDRRVCIENGILLNLIWLISRRAMCIVDVECPEEKLGMAWVAFVKDPLRSESDDSVENPHLLLTIGCFAEVSTNLYFKRFCKMLLKPTNVLASGKRGEVVTMNHNSNVSAAVVKATWVGHAPGKPKGF